MRVYFEKPRTTVGWKGLIYDPNLNDTFDIDEGLRTARRLMHSIAEVGVYTGTEFLDPIVPQYLADLVCWSTIGARTTESQTHRQMASGLSMPVGFKNGTDGSAQIAVDAMISAKSAHAFLGIDSHGQDRRDPHEGQPGRSPGAARRSREGPNFGAESVAEAHRLLNEAQVRSELLVDCSHGNSNKDHRQQQVAFKDVVEQRASGNDHIIGCMLESNLNPGSQKITGDRSTLEYGVSVTDACIGWDETETLLRWAYDQADTRVAVTAD